MTVITTRYPEVFPYGSNNMNLDSLRTLQANVSHNFDVLESRMQILENALAQSLNFASWINEFHPAMTREYHATQLALNTLEEPPTPAP
jgi:hypothetical protein